MIDIVVDTNILLRYVLNDNLEQALIAQSYLNNQQYRCILAMQTFCEIDWVLRKTVKVKRDKVVEFFEMLVSRENIQFNRDEFYYGLEFLKQGGDFADGIIAYQTEQYPNAKFLSFDKQARKIAQSLNIDLKIN